MIYSSTLHSIRFPPFLAGTAWATALASMVRIYDQVTKGILINLCVHVLTSAPTPGL